jgi:monofunctional glycosyltransferase
MTPTSLPSKTNRSTTVRADPATARTAPERRKERTSARMRTGTWIRLLVQAAALLAVAYGLIIAGLIFAYRTTNPPASTLMLWQRAKGIQIEHAWTPLARISPNLARAVVMSEDSKFCRHTGVDWQELEQAYERAGDGIPRGGSTISMQVIKNLFLWPSKSYLRKALEIPITLAAEMVWSKRRMLEIYLNIAEWGPGVFGAEAAAQYHFSKSAAALTASEAALLAVALPNPIARDAGEPDARLQKRAATIQTRAQGADAYTRCLSPLRPATKP